MDWLPQSAARGWRCRDLGAGFGPDALWIWTGPASVPFGSEIFDNATGAAESDSRKLWGARHSPALLTLA